MKKTILFALALAGASAFAQTTSDTTFVTFDTHLCKEYQDVLLMDGPFYDMGLVNGVVYTFKRKSGFVYALPLDLPLTAPMMVYPEKNHTYKYGELVRSERWEKEGK